ncbi:sulfotransferase family 2 domain-containing protein [Campylobacter jejuni]
MYQKLLGTSIERVVFETDKWLVGHVRALDYINQDKNKFESYFSFAFVRNPFDRMVSAFHYLKKAVEMIMIKIGRMKI